MSTLLLVGHGKMGGVLCERLRNTAIFSEIHIISPNHSHSDLAPLFWHRDLTSIPGNVAPDVILLAVKPAMLESILPQYAAHFTHAPLYLSVAAGKTLAFYQQHLGPHAHIVRAMPNTPSLIGEGMTALCAPDTLSAAMRKTAEHIMAAVGKVLWVEESQMNAVTALSGCGPAYVFLFLDALVQASVKAGLSEAQAKTLALQTVTGSTALAAHSTKTFDQLCTQVASPGGATEAALKILNENNNLKMLMEKAVTAALARAKEMAQ